jgi:hypothetical protein
LLELLLFYPYLRVGRHSGDRDLLLFDFLGSNFIMGYCSIIV